MQDERLIVALDVDSGRQALQLASLLKPVTQFFKIGSYLFTLEGPPLIRQLTERGFRVFLDLKFHDIPEIVAGAVRRVGRLGVSMVTVHTSGGREMMKAAAAAAGESPAAVRPLLLGVTVLTSFSEDQWKEISGNDSLNSAVQRLAMLAQSAGLGGIVCAPQDLTRLANVHLKKVVPGIRLAGSSPDDQQRIMTPVGALACGADYLVVGRPITRAKDPLQAAWQIREQMARR